MFVKDVDSTQSVREIILWFGLFSLFAWPMTLIILGIFIIFFSYISFLLYLKRKLKEKNKTVETAEEDIDHDAYNPYL
jgi:predicted membrane protein